MFESFVVRAPYGRTANCKLIHKIRYPDDSFGCDIKSNISGSGTPSSEFALYPSYPIGIDCGNPGTL